MTCELFVAIFVRKVVELFSEFFQVSGSNTRDRETRPTSSKTVSVI